METPVVEDASDKRICMDGNVNDDNNDGKNNNKTVEMADGKNKSSNCDEEKDSFSQLKKMCRLMHKNVNAEDEIDMGNLLDDIAEKEEEDVVQISKKKLVSLLRIAAVAFSTNITG